MNLKKKFFCLLTVLVIISGVLFAMLINSIPKPAEIEGKYIKSEKDEIRGYYTSLYFDYTGQNSVVVLENGVSYASFKLTNYIGEDVTKRDIEYNITTVKKFYDAKGNEITNPDGSEDLYVLDVWGTPQKVGNDTCKYEFKVVSNDGEKRGDNYLFSYETSGSISIGKTHNLTVGIKRKSDVEELKDTIEHISIVVQLNKPYTQVYVINMIVSNRLIAFSQIDNTLFDIDFKTLQIQTANVFSHAGKDERYSPDGTSLYDGKAFLVELTWKNLIFNEDDLNKIHNGFDLELQEKLLSGDASNIDISKPYVFSITSSNKSSGTLALYIPQASDFSLDFLPTNQSDYEIKAKVKVCMKDNEYKLYDTSLGGYEMVDDYIIVMSSDKTKITK